MAISEEKSIKGQQCRKSSVLYQQYSNQNSWWKMSILFLVSTVLNEDNFWNLTYLLTGAVALLKNLDTRFFKYLFSSFSLRPFLFVCLFNRGDSGGEVAFGLHPGGVHCGLFLSLIFFCLLLLVLRGFLNGFNRKFYDLRFNDFFSSVFFFF